MKLVLKTEDLDIEAVRTIIEDDMGGYVYSPYDNPEEVYECNPEDVTEHYSVHEGDGFYTTETSYINTPEGYNPERCDWFIISYDSKNKQLIIEEL